MRPGVVTCSPDDGLATLAEILVTHGIHAAFLAPLGRANPVIVTDRDLMRAALERPADAPLSAIAREAAATISSDATLEAAGTMMAERYVRHLLVIDVLSRAPAGVISSFDVIAEVGGLHPPGGARALAPRSPRHRSLVDTTVGDVMHLGIATCDADASLPVVARTMVGQRIHCVAIAGIEDAGHHLMWGLIDDLDLVVAQHRGALAEPAASIAVTSPMAVGEADSLARAAWLMAEHNTSHIVVVGSSRLPIGIVSTLDIASVLAHQAP
jgi:CBS domain-containing protein